MYDLPIMVLNIKLLHHTWVSHNISNLVTSFMFKEHIRESLSLESQSEAPPEQDVWKYLKFLIRKTTIWN